MIAIIQKDARMCWGLEFPYFAIALELSLRFLPFAYCRWV